MVAPEDAYLNLADLDEDVIAVRQGEERTAFNLLALGKSMVPILLFILQDPCYCREFRYFEFSSGYCCCYNFLSGLLRLLKTETDVRSFHPGNRIFCFIAVRMTNFYEIPKWILLMAKRLSFNVGGKRDKYAWGRCGRRRLRTRRAIRLRDKVSSQSGRISFALILAGMGICDGKVTIAQRDHDISLLDPCHFFCVSSLHVGFQDFKKKIEVQKEEQAQELYNRVAELEAYVMDVSGRLEGEFYPTYLTTLAGRRWLLAHGVQLALLKCLKSSEYQGILGHALGRAVDFGMQAGLEAGHEHESTGRSLYVVDAYNPEAAKANYIDAVKALEDVDFPLVNLLKSRRLGWVRLVLLRLLSSLRIIRKKTRMKPREVLLPCLSWRLLIFRSVGMPISAGMTAFVLYVSANGVSPLLDLIVVRLDSFPQTPACFFRPNACAEAGSLITSLTSERDRLTSEVSTLHAAFQDFKAKAEAQQEEQAQVLYNRVAELEAHVMDVSGRILGHALGRAVDFGMQEGLEAGYEHGVAGTQLSAVEAYNPEAARTSYFDAVRTLEDVDFPLVNLLKSKKDAEMGEVLECFILDGPLADLPKAAHLQPCLEQLSVPIHHSDDKAIVGETSLSFALLNVHSRAEGAKKHVAALRQLMMEIVSNPLSSQTWVGETSTSAAPLSVEDFDEEDTDEALGSVVSIPKFEACRF
ncbi:hypothetical protein Tco_0771714 [Tanacetum coccineum]|uniref:Uncharacterized protein n=1 Tax=Tanacetum coccineum TaxID=301880 RepID=A0ABQ4ZJW0_9ASTR